MVSGETVICSNCEGRIITPDGARRCKHDWHLCDKPIHYETFQPVHTNLVKARRKVKK